MKNYTDSKVTVVIKDLSKDWTHRREVAPPSDQIRDAHVTKKPPKLSPFLSERTLPNSQIYPSSVNQIGMR